MRWIPLRSDDPKLDAVLARLCQQLGDLWTMQAVKLPYLVDLISKRIQGTEVTNSHHKAWKLGVVTARAWGLIQKAHGGEYFRVYGDPVADGLKVSLSKNPPDVLSDLEKRIVDFVANEFGGLSADELGRFTKELNPDITSWGGQDIVPLTEDAYRRLPIWFGEDEADAEEVSQIAHGEVLTDEEVESLLTRFGR